MLFNVQQKADGNVLHSVKRMGELCGCGECLGNVRGDMSRGKCPDPIVTMFHRAVVDVQSIKF